MSSITPTIYPQLPYDLDRLLAERAVAIHALVKRTLKDVVEVGRHLSEVRNLVDHGRWLAWIETEFGWSDQTARRFIHVYTLSTDPKLNTVLNLDLPFNTLYQLAAPRAVAAREEIAEWIEAGEPVTKEMVVAAITGRRNSPTEPEPVEPDLTEFDAAASAEVSKAAPAAMEAADGAGAVEHLDGEHARLDHDGEHARSPAVEPTAPKGTEPQAETLVAHWQRCPDELGALLDASGFEVVRAAMSPDFTAQLQARAKQPTNLILKLRELDRGAAAQLLLDAFGWSRLCAIIGKVTDLRTPKGRSSKSDKSGKPGQSGGQPFTKTITLIADNSCPIGMTTVSGNNAGKAGCSPKRASR